MKDTKSFYGTYSTRFNTYLYKFYTLKDALVGVRISDDFYNIGQIIIVFISGFLISFIYHINSSCICKILLSLIIISMIILKKLLLFYLRKYFAKKQAKQEEKYEKDGLDLNKVLTNNKNLYIKLENIAETAILLDEENKKIDLHIAALDKRKYHFKINEVENFSEIKSLILHFSPNIKYIY